MVHASAAVALKMPPGHSQRIKAAHPLSVLASCGPHWLSMHAMQAWLLPLVSRHELSLSPPLLVPLPLLVPFGPPSSPGPMEPTVLPPHAAANIRMPEKRRTKERMA
jgi:hypothetical protein